MHSDLENNGQSDRLPVTLQPPSLASQGASASVFLALSCSSKVILDQTIHDREGNTPIPFVTNSALDEVKDSIHELRSILLRGRGRPYEPYYGVEIGRRSRRSIHSEVGPPSESRFQVETNGPNITFPASSLEHPPPPAGLPFPSLWRPNSREQRPRQTVHMQSQTADPVVIPSFATGQELEFVNKDFSSIIIIVGALSFPKELSFVFFWTS